MSRTTKPCPGCGGNYPHRRANQVCHECSSLLKEAIAARKAAAKSKEIEGVVLPFAPYCLPHFYKHKGEFKGERPADGIHEFMFQIVALVGKQVEGRLSSAEMFPTAVYGDYGYVLSGESGCDSGGQTYWFVPRGLKKMLNDLFSAIRAERQKAYDEGHVEGSSLLVGLATGDTSIDEFNRLTVGKVANKKRRTK